MPLIFPSFSLQELAYLTKYHIFAELSLTTNFFAYETILHNFVSDSFRNHRAG